MRMLVRIKGHTGYVDMPIQDNEPNPYANPYGDNLRLYCLDMEVVESPDLEAGKTVGVLFKRGEIEILEEI